MLFLAQAGDIVFAVSFVVYTLFIVAVGLYSARFARRSDEDFFLAGRSLGPWVAALSASASSESGWVTLGLVGWAFASGAQAYWIIPGCLLGFLFNWFVIAGRLREEAARTQALTLPDMLALRFRERLPLIRVFSVIVILTAMLLYVAAQFAAAGKAFEASFASVDYRTGVLIGAGIVLVYTVLGGFRAACWTDFVQGLIMLGTLVVFPIYLLIDLGGVSFLSHRLGELNDGHFLAIKPVFEQTGPWAVAAMLGFLLGSGAMGINFGYPGQPHVLVRFMALRDAREAKLAGIISTTWALLVLGGAVTMGLLVRAFTEGAAEWTDPLAAELVANAGDKGERGLVLAAKHLVPGVLSGMVLAAVLAAICSTADSQLVVAASAVASDLYSKLIERTHKLGHVIINRTVVLALGIAAVAIVLDREINVYTYVLTYGWATLGAAFGPQVIVMLFFRGASSSGCLSGMITGFVVALAWPQLYDPAEFHDIQIYNLPLAFMAALLVNLVVSRLRPDPEAEEQA